MISVLLDTNTYAPIRRGIIEAAELVRHVDSIGIPTVVLGELLAGFATGNRAERNRLELKQFLASPRIRVLAVDIETCTHYAMVYASLRTKGRPIPSNDMWIAAIALQHNLALYSYDAHFREVAGVQVVTSLSELLG